ncbi:tetratricopeptide repeat protein [Acinetobacter nosocomialis]|uniref:tetratricopeptide repeat protein n=1 Tax=Acinetobacter nosocomialis TaxID=106654 RepID=UPI00066963A7|nr:tetratricopeptide repeat protein [Acinetobacter nosocomialis]
MNKLRTIMLLSCLVFTSNLFAETDDENFQKEFDSTALKAKNMTNKEILREVGLIQDMNQTKSTMATSLKLAPYVAELSKRDEAGDLEAKFISTSLWKRTACEMMVEQKMYSTGDTCTDVVKNLKIIANTKTDKLYIAKSMVLLGDIYNEGKVTSRSNLLSAEWYFKGSKKYNELGNRDEAIKALEKSLQENPNYEPARKYLKTLTLDKAP